ncbi:MAG: hypothetical protein KDA53_05630 [Hyphomonas sp.]|nr:hypothetical protein [Hyphomonas sp.]
MKFSAYASLAAALAAGALAALVWTRSYPDRPDGFFRADMPDGAPHGTLIRTESFTRAVPDGAEARRILYTTELSDGTPATASAIVMWKPAAATGAPAPVIAWAQGTAGISTGCGLSLQANPFADIPAIPNLLDEGWVYVSSDYAGLTTPGPHPYLIGPGEAYSVLDAVHAAHEMDGPALAADTLVWGHSQGGHSALWTGRVAAGYAPDISVKGVAAISPGADLPELLKDMQAGLSRRILVAYAARAYSEAYPDVEFGKLVRAGVRWRARELSRRCFPGPHDRVMIALAAGLDGPVLGPDREAFVRHLKENVPIGQYDMPVLILQGAEDEIVAADIQARFAGELCERGTVVDYHALPGRDHLSVVYADSAAIPTLMDWSRARLKGAPAPTSCSAP